MVYLLVRMKICIEVALQVVLWKTIVTIIPRATL